MKIKKEYEKLLSDIRGELHKIPEIGFKEFKTSKYIENRLRKLSPDRLEKVAETGWIAFFEGTEGKRTLAFRADMDGLPVEECEKHEKISEHRGMMHACGHDGHMSILLVFGQFLAENRKRIKDNVVLVFQPAEEGPGGAEVVAGSKVFEELNIDGIFGLHLFPLVEQGKIALKEGPIMAQSGEIDVLVHGRSSHGAQPQEGIDAVVASAAFITEIQKIASRFIKPIDPAVITLGKAWGGEARNIVAGEMSLEGTIRTFSEDVYLFIKKRIRDIADGIEIVYGCRIETVFRDMYPPVINDKVLVERLRKSYRGEFVDIEPQMLAEDFSYYQKKVPGLFFFLGTKNEEKGLTSPLHSQDFNFDESVLVKGLEAYASLIE
ncbi:MAG TPA: amidohydrolase [Clostridia bacterium]|nr:amidohydrolase [Clostridia bacterium]